MRTIVVADALMGVDNVLGVAGAHGRFDLVVIGLVVSVPIVVWGSTLVLRLIDRFPAITVGAGVLALHRRQDDRRRTAADAWFDPISPPVVATYLLLVAGVLAAGTLGRPAPAPGRVPAA